MIDIIQYGMEAIRNNKEHWNSSMTLRVHTVRGSELARGGDPSDGHGRTGVVGRPSRDST
eukprot:2746274-Pleurochrysis_carterae.AAC.1